jgi:GT2 family glycosyltransferase
MVNPEPPTTDAPDDLEVQIDPQDAEQVATAAGVAEPDTVTKVSVATGGGADAAAELAAARCDIAAQQLRIAQLEGALGEADRELRLARESVTWRLVLWVRARIRGPIGHRLGIDRLISAFMRGVGHLMSISVHRSARNVVLPTSETPEATIVVAVHADCHVVERCLRTIAEARTTTPFEVVLVPDNAPRKTRRLLKRRVSGARLLAPGGDGFLLATNRGSAEALGRFIVLLNDDTLVLDDWLDALVERADSDVQIGAVGAQLLELDGRLQEAGSIIWRDGTGWNYGKGDDPERARYRFVREVDYCSGAALLVRRDAFEQLGGLDERFAPAYYEDADLCFGLRDLGLKVVYEPASQLLHRQGTSYGDAEKDSASARLQRRNRKRFVEKWSAELEHQSLTDRNRLDRHADRNQSDRVLVWDHQMLTPDRDAGSVRMWEMIRQLRALGTRVTFIPDNLYRNEPYSRRLGGLGVEVLDGPVDLAAELARLGPELHLAILSRPHVAAHTIDYVRELAPDATVIYDTVDLHHVRERRRAEVGGLSFGKAAALKEVELAMVRASDITIAVSEEERTIILDEVPDASVAIIGIIQPPHPEGRSADQREGLLFVGGFAHTPNIDAAVRLIRDVMPRVWCERPDTNVTVVGTGPPELVRGLGGPRVDVAGWVEDIAPLLDDARALVAPLSYGAGVKGKITSALAAGLPVVTTRVGAEGIPQGSDHALLIGDTDEELAANVLAICEDDELWDERSQAGRRVADRLTSPKIARDLFKAWLAEPRTPR